MCEYTFMQKFNSYFLKIHQVMSFIFNSHPWLMYNYDRLIKQLFS